MRFWITLCATGPRRKPSVKFPTRSRFYNLRLPKSSENFQIVDYCRFQAQKKIVVKTRFHDYRRRRIHWQIAGGLDARRARMFFRLARRKIRHLCRSNSHFPHVALGKSRLTLHQARNHNRHFWFLTNLSLTGLARDAFDRLFQLIVIRDGFVICASDKLA